MKTEDDRDKERHAPGAHAFLYCRPPGFTVASPGKCLAGGLQSGCTANLTGLQYKMVITAS